MSCNLYVSHTRCFLRFCFFIPTILFYHLHCVMPQHGMLTCTLLHVSPLKELFLLTLILISFSCPAVICNCLFRPLVRSEAPNSKKPRKSAEKALQEMRKAAPPKSTLTRSNSLRMPKSSSVSSLPTGKPAAGGAASSSRPLRSHMRTASQGRSRTNSVDISTGSEPNADSTAAKKPSKMPSLLK